MKGEGRGRGLVVGMRSTEGGEDADVLEVGKTINVKCHLKNYFPKKLFPNNFDCQLNIKN